MILTRALTFSIALSLAAPLAFADKDRGGGITVNCKVGKLENKRIVNSHYLADTWAFYLRTYFGHFPKISEQQILTAVYFTLNHQSPGLGSEIREIIAKKLKFKPVLRLRYLGTDNFKMQQLKQGCRVKQFAVQNVTTGEVKYIAEIYKHLLPVETALWKLHEAYVYKYQVTGDTTPVREMVEDVVLSEYFLHFMEERVILDQLMELSDKEKIRKVLTAFREAYIVVRGQDHFVFRRGGESESSWKEFGQVTFRPCDFGACVEKSKSSASLTRYRSGFFPALFLRDHGTFYDLTKTRTGEQIVAKALRERGQLIEAARKVSDYFVWNLKPSKDSIE